MSVQIERSSEARFSRFSLVRAVRRRLAQADRAPPTGGTISDEASGIDAFTRRMTSFARTLRPVVSRRLLIPTLHLTEAHSRGNIPSGAPHSTQIRHEHGQSTTERQTRSLRSDLIRHQPNPSNRLASFNSNSTCSALPTSPNALGSSCISHP